MRMRKRIGKVGYFYFIIIVILNTFTAALENCGNMGKPFTKW